MSCVRECSRGMPEVPEAEEGRARGPESVGEPPGGPRSHGARMGEPGRRKAGHRRLKADGGKRAN